MFFKNKKIDSWVKKVDKIVTWIIIGWALAWLFWLSKTKKWKEFTNSITNSLEPQFKSVSKKSIWLFWKIIAFFVWIFHKDK